MLKLFRSTVNTVLEEMPRTTSLWTLISTIPVKVEVREEASYWNSMYTYTDVHDPCQGCLLDPDRVQEEAPLRPDLQEPDRGEGGGLFLNLDLHDRV